MHLAHVRHTATSDLREADALVGPSTRAIPGSALTAAALCTARTGSSSTKNSAVGTTISQLVTGNMWLASGRVLLAGSPKPPPMVVLCSPHAAHVGAVLRLASAREVDELPLINLANAIDFGIADHLADLFIRECLPNDRPTVPNVRRVYEPIAVAVANLERLGVLQLRVRDLRPARHEGQKLWEVGGAVHVRVRLADH